MPTLQPIGGQRGILAPLVLITSFWIGGCQSLEIKSEGMVGSDPGWKISRQAGLVSLRSPGRSFWQRAIPGGSIAPGSQVATYRGSRLELASAGDKVTTSGPSRFTLPEAEDEGVRVRQDAGSVRYEVESAPRRRFEVKTPHFSTVVKGTAFRVSIDRTSSEVFVDEGRVLILDPSGKPLTELTAGQTGRMAAQPGATLEVGTAFELSFESAMPGAGLEASADGDTGFPDTTNATGASLRAPISEAEEPTPEPSLVERIASAFDDLAGQLRRSAALTTQDVNVGTDQGGGGREQERQSSRFDGSHVDEDGNGKGGKGQGKDRGKGKGKDKGKGKGKGKGEGKGSGRSNGHGHGRGKGAGGGGAYNTLDRGDHLVAWNGQP